MAAVKRDGARHGAGHVVAMVESPAMSGADNARARPRRRLTPTDYVVRVPLGLLSLVLLAIVVVPVMIYMTALYFATRWTSALFTGRRPQRAEGANREERVA